MSEVVELNIGGDEGAGSDEEVPPTSISGFKVGGTLINNFRAKNDVWQFFKVYKEKNFSKVACCMLCKDADASQPDITYGTSHSTGVLERHIYRHHEEENSLLIAAKRQKLLSSNSSPASSSSVQSAMTSYATPCPLYESMLLNWIVMTYQPFSTVENNSFREMVTSLNKKAPVISREKIQKLISNKYHDTRLSLSSILKGKHYSMTCDGWTSRAQVGYTTGTVHLINNWKLHHFVLGLHQKNGASTAQDVVSYTEELMDKVSIDFISCICITTDTEATMVSAGKLFLEKSNTMNWGGCLDHLLELVTKIAFNELAETEATMADARSLVGLFSRSTQATRKLREESKQRLGVEYTVIQDVCTRWWSTYAMGNRLLTLKDCILILNLRGDIETNLTDGQWKVLQDIVALLKPFMIAQRLLEGQYYVTISLVPYVLHKIRTGLNEAFDSPAISEALKAVLTKMLLKFVEAFGSGSDGAVASDHLTRGPRQRPRGIPKHTLIASLLDPRTKGGVGIPATDQLNVWEWIESEMVIVTQEVHVLEAAIEGTGVAENHDAQLGQGRKMRAHEQDLDDFFSDIAPVLHGARNCHVADAERQRNEEAAMELRLYKSEPLLSMKDSKGEWSDPLQWWAGNQHKFPSLARLASMYLAIPASSAPSERVFTSAGLTIAKDRARLLPSRADELVFLHDSLPALKRYNDGMRRMG